MSLSRDEAAEALNAIEQAGERATRLKGYRFGAPFVLLWGVQWLVANTLTQFNAALGNWAWMIGVPLIIVAGMIVGFRNNPDPSRMSPAEAQRHRRQGGKWALTSLVSWPAVVGFFAVLWPMSQQQFTAGISLLWMIVYIVAGIWVGWRLFWIGMAGAAAILTGYYFIDEYFFLWMGLVGGGALLAGGLWMRQA